MGFGSVTSQALKAETTRELVLNQITIFGEHPVLVVAHLGPSNAAFWSDALAKSGTKVNAADAAATKGTTPEKVEEARRENRDAVARFSVRDTRGFFHDRDGEPGVPDPNRPATQKDIREIIMALPNDVFDPVMRFVVNPENFRDRPPLANPKDIAEKS